MKNCAVKKLKGVVNDSLPIFGALRIHAKGVSSLSGIIIGVSDDYDVTSVVKTSGGNTTLNVGYNKVVFPSSLDEDILIEGKYNITELDSYKQNLGTARSHLDINVSDLWESTTKLFETPDYVHWVNYTNQDFFRNIPLEILGGYNLDLNIVKDIVTLKTLTIVPEYNYSDVNLGVLSSLTNLETLNIYNKGVNEFTTNIFGNPSDFGPLKKLTNLQLSYCRCFTGKHLEDMFVAMYENGRNSGELSVKIDHFGVYLFETYYEVGSANATIKAVFNSASPYIVVKDSNDSTIKSYNGTSWEA